LQGLLASVEEELGLAKLALAPDEEADHDQNTLVRPLSRVANDNDTMVRPPSRSAYNQAQVTAPPPRPPGPKPAQPGQQSPVVAPPLPEPPSRTHRKPGSPIIPKTPAPPPPTQRRVYSKMWKFHILNFNTGGSAYSYIPRKNLRKPPQKPTHLKNKFIRSWRAAYSYRQKIGFLFKRS
jgi:hypothetical protein